MTFNHMHTDCKGFFNFMTAKSGFSRTNGTTIKVGHIRALAEKAAFKSFPSKHRTHDTTFVVHEGGEGENPSPSAKLGLRAMKAFEVMLCPHGAK